MQITYSNSNESHQSDGDSVDRCVIRPAVVESTAGVERVFTTVAVKEMAADIAEDRVAIRPLPIERGQSLHSK